MESISKISKAHPIVGGCRRLWRPCKGSLWPVVDPNKATADDNLWSPKIELERSRNMSRYPVALRPALNKRALHVDRQWRRNRIRSSGWTGRRGEEAIDPPPRRWRRIKRATTFFPSRFQAIPVSLQCSGKSNRETKEKPSASGREPHQIRNSFVEPVGWIGNQ